MLTGNLHKAICLEDGSRVSVQNSSFEQYEVAVCAFNTDTHVAMGFSRVDDSVEVTAEICDDAGATLRNSEIDADLIMGLFSNSFVSASGVGAAGVESWYRNKEVLKQTINMKQCMFLRGPICYFIAVFPKRIAKIEK